MDQIEKTVAPIYPGVVKLLQDNDVVDQSLILFDEKDLITMGITALGPRKMILNIIDQMRNRQEEQIAHPEPTITREQKIKDTLIADDDFRSIYYDVLANELIPTKGQLCSMVRVLTKKWKSDIFAGKPYPTIAMQHSLAKDIIATFPFLGRTKCHPDAPAESAFFWHHSGKETGDHNGFIYHRVRNIIKPLDPSKKKYRRSLTLQGENSIPNSMMQVAAAIAILRPTLDNYDEIKKGTLECIPLLKLAIKEKKTAHQLLITLPHLISYDGQLMRLCFHQLHPLLQQQGDLKSVLCKGLILSPFYSRVEDALLRGALRIFSRLHKKGKRDQVDQLQDTNDAEEIMAAPLVRWTQDGGHGAKDFYAILCHANAFEKGAYSISFNGFQHGRFDSIVDALMEFYMMFRVFGIAPPISIAMWDDVIAILIFKQKLHSSRKVVNEVCHRILEGEEAQGSAE